MEACPLSDAHRDQLLRRGLTEGEIERGGYGSLPADRDRRHEIAAAVVEAVGDAGFGNIPGLYRDRAGVPMIAGVAGLIIPSRAADGQLQGLRIRADDAATGGKYRWLSSLDRDGGCGSGSPAHLARPKSDPANTARVVFTEGELAANIVAERLGLPAIGVPGVTNFAAGLDQLAALGVAEVVTAYDADKATNPNVARAEADLHAALSAAGYGVSRLTWPETFKGVDDALVAGVMPLVEPVTADLSPCTERLATVTEERDSLRRELLDLRKTHALVTQAMRSPRLGPERTTATAIVLDLRGTADVGEWTPMPHARIADQAGCSVRAVPRHLAKTGAFLDGYVEFKKDMPPAGRGDAAASGEPGHLWTFARLTADPLSALQAIAVAVPEKGHKNGNGGKRIPCPDCGDVGIIRRQTDACAGCGQLLAAGETRIPPTTGQSVMREDPPPADRTETTPGEPTGQSVMYPSDAATATTTVPPHNTPSDTVRRYASVASGHNGAVNRLDAARRDLDRRRAAADAQSPLTAADRAAEAADFKHATGQLFTVLTATARERGRAPVPKPTGAGGMSP